MSAMPARRLPSSRKRPKLIRFRSFATTFHCPCTTGLSKPPSSPTISTAAPSSSGIDFRDYIFEHQPEIFPTNLRQFAEKFAADHKVDLPFVVDPQGKFAAEVNAEQDLGKSLHLEHTPTIYVVSSKVQGPSLCGSQRKRPAFSDHRRHEGRVIVATSGFARMRVSWR